jgi:hypothetical protein
VLFFATGTLKTIIIRRQGNNILFAFYSPCIKLISSVEESISNTISHAYCSMKSSLRELSFTHNSSELSLILMFITAKLNNHQFYVIRAEDIRNENFYNLLSSPRIMG